MVEANRTQNSKREFKISKTKKNKKNGSRGLKSPSDFTNVAKSVVSMFSTHSGKTTQSAPLHDNSPSLGSSPQNQSSNKKIRLLNKVAKNSKIKIKKQNIRPASSVSPGVKSQK